MGYTKVLINASTTEVLGGQDLADFPTNQAFDRLFDQV